MIGPKQMKKVIVACSMKLSMIRINVKTPVVPT